MEHSDVVAIIKQNLPEAKVWLVPACYSPTIFVVSERFENTKTLDRYQKVLEFLPKDLKEMGLHNLRIQVYTPAEWREMESRRNRLLY